MKTILLAFSLILLNACTAEAPLDPAGVYDLTYTPTSGSCGIEEAATGSFGIIDTGDFYAIGTDDPEENFGEGGIECEDTCTVNVTSSGGDSEGTFSATYMLEIFRDGDVEGSLDVVAVFSGFSCTQAYSVRGRKR